MAKRKRESVIGAEMLDELARSIKTEDDLNAVMRQLSKGLLERVLAAEMTEHLGHENGGVVINPEGNTRNGVSKKTVKGELGEVELEVPRDRQGDFEPQLVKKHQRRLAGLDKKILSLYTRGLSTRDIQAELKEMYEVEVSPSPNQRGHGCCFKRSQSVAVQTSRGSVSCHLPGLHFCQAAG